MKRFTALMLAALMAIACVPALAELVPADVPRGYDAHDYSKLLAFMETPCYDGIKNGEDLCENYDPLDPVTWTCAEWTEEEPKKLASFNVGNWGGLLGVIDLEDCTELTALYCSGNPISGVNVNGCVSLKVLEAQCDSLVFCGFEGCAQLEVLRYGFAGAGSLDLTPYRRLRIVEISPHCLSGLTLGSHPLLEELRFGYNDIASIDVSGCPVLQRLECAGNKLACLDTAACRALKYLDCSHNELESLEIYREDSCIETVNCTYNRLPGVDFSGTMLMPRVINVEGMGFAGCASSIYSYGTRAVQATPAEGWRMSCWINGAGQIFSHNEYYSGPNMTGELTAVFEKTHLAGDADGNDSIDTADALMVLRWALYLEDMPANACEYCDMDGNEEIDTTDALLILRMAMGIGRKSGTRTLYNGHDAQKLAAFFEQEDENGVKNGEKLFVDYDPLDPASWEGKCVGEHGEVCDVIEWNEDGSLRAFNVLFADAVGELELDGCEALEVLHCHNNRLTRLSVRGCGELTYIKAQHNELTSVDLNGPVHVFYLMLNDNRLTSIDFAGFGHGLNYFDLSDNLLTELDLTGMEYLDGFACRNNLLTSLTVPPECEYLNGFSCDGNALTELNCEIETTGTITCSNNPLTRLDLSGTDLGYFDIRNCPLTELKLKAFGCIVDLKSAGHGTIGAYLRDVPWTFEEDHGEDLTLTVYARPEYGWQLDAWIDENGYWAYFYEESDIWVNDPAPKTLTAVFEPAGFTPGDADENGAVDTTDALLVLRAAMGIEGDQAALLETCDMDQNSVIDTSDALIVLRRALGIS